ncbi:MetQ/NlpA family ABC transporter substrate-binding protein, partial [Nocardioides yefusunii]
IVGLAIFFTQKDDDETTNSSGEKVKVEKVKLGIVSAGEDYWDTLADAAKAEGIDLEIVNFADYPQPNPALSEGEIDINQFQHIVYLADHNVKAGDDLTVLGSTAIYPLALYSDKYDDVAAIKDGETVIVPDDESNQARALLVLQSAGLIKLNDGGSIYSTLADIDKGASKVEVKALQADLIPASLADVAAGFVNNDWVSKAGLKFEDAILKDDPTDPSALPYVNVFAVRGEDKDNATLKKLVEIYQTNKDVQAGVLKASSDTATLVQTPVEDLRTSLATVEADSKKQN